MEGWNDPPKNVGQPTGNLKINLNKRVAFPLGSAPIAVSQEASSASPPLLPPMTPPKATLVNRFSNSTNEEITATLVASDPKNDNDREQMMKALCTLKIAANQLENPSKDIILTKLKAFDDDWKKCEKEVQTLLSEMTDFMEAEDFKNAAAVHRKIVLKGYNRPWIASIRQLIMGMERLKEKDDVLDDVESTSAIVNPLDITTDNVDI